MSFWNIAYTKDNGVICNGELNGYRTHNQILSKTTFEIQNPKFKINCSNILNTCLLV